MRKIFFGLLLAMTAATLSWAQAATLQATPFATVKEKIGHGQPVMLEVGSDHCLYCRKMGELLYRFKRAHPNAPIYFVNVGKERQAALALHIQMIPTQILFDGQGKEVYRHVGVLSYDDVGKILVKYGGMKERR
ncbi:thioredoxin family protein [Hydrogenimonas sp. SS33]|uniref:thioredoxin family protein n=1 Tax=Hydrogenimonas leucolamina TaxID=2954236 RepID=UPI00336C096A